MHLLLFPISRRLVREAVASGAGSRNVGTGDMVGVGYNTCGKTYRLGS